MTNFHLWEDTEKWNEDPEKNGATFHGAFETVEELADWCEEFQRKFEENQTYEYDIVTMGDMSPAALYASGGEDPEDIHVEHIGTYTEEEARKLKKEWEEDYAYELSHGCWITKMGTYPMYEIELWNGKGWKWFDPFEEDREKLILSASPTGPRWNDEEPLPLPSEAA